MEEFDQLILCIPADQAKKVLGKTITWKEKFLLGSVKYSNDVTVTHHDHLYMEKYYTNSYDEDQAVEYLHGRNEKQRCLKAKQSFRPMYFIKEYSSNPRKLEMSFDCTNYQSQFPKDLPLSRHIFQTIFLNEKDSSIWSKHEINREKILREDWWHQLCHSWTHYLCVIPWIWLINGQNSTVYAAAWTLVNAHEVAAISGFAAAYRLGVDYPQTLKKNPFAFRCFKLYLFLIHGMIYSDKSHQPKKNS